MIKRILLIVLALLVIIQFIRPAENHSDKLSANDIALHYPLPDTMLSILKNSCYDCHSNNTRYPWYSFIQPGAWWMASHIREGKADLNFSDFGTYSERRRQSKLQAIANSIKDKTMPLRSYLLLHGNARLSPDDKTLLLDWINKTKDSRSLKNN